MAQETLVTGEYWYLSAAGSSPMGQCCTGRISWVYPHSSGSGWAAPHLLLPHPPSAPRLRPGWSRATPLRATLFPLPPSFIPCSGQVAFLPSTSTCKSGLGLDCFLSPPFPPLPLFEARVLPPLPDQGLATPGPTRQLDY